MTLHHLRLTDATVGETRHLLMTGQAVADVVECSAMGAIVGPEGLGKTFAIGTLRGRSEPVLSLTFESRPTGAADRRPAPARPNRPPARGTRFAMTHELLRRLAERPRLVVIGEAQNLNCDCFEYLLHDGQRCPILIRCCSEPRLVALLSTYERFHRIDRLPNHVARAIDRWLAAHQDATPEDLRALVRLSAASADPDRMRVQTLWPPAWAGHARPRRRIQSR